MASQFPAGLFNFSSKLNFFASEISLLSAHATVMGQNVWERVNDNTADQGFEIVSESGAVASFFVADVDVQEGEIQGWRLKPTLETVARLPQLKSSTMLVVNT